MPLTRSASLRVAHSRSCPNVTKSALASSEPGSGCTCDRPSYFTVHRDSAGRAIRGPRVRDRRTADRALRKLLVEIDENRVGVGSRTETMSVGAWCDLFIDRLETVRAKSVKPSTVRAYVSTIRTYVKPTIGTIPLRDLGTADLDRLVAEIRASGASEMTVHKHLRHVGAILRAAERRTPPLLDRSPLTAAYIDELGIERVGGTEAFTDVEVAKLLLTMRKLEYADVYVLAVRALLTTGMCVGELVALDWGQVNMTAKTIRVVATYDPLAGIVPPKTRKTRIINMIPAALAVFEDIVKEIGDGPDDAPVLPAPRSGDRLNARYLGRIVGEAIETAGIPIVGEGGRRRRPLHSLRATYTRVCLEAGLDATWTQRQLGHAALGMTVNVYGRWADERMAEEATKLEAFPG